LVNDILSKIVALRQRLEQAQGLVRDAGSAAVAPLEAGAAGPDPVRQLERKVAAGSRQHALLDGSLRQLPDVAAPGVGGGLPSQLTARAGRLLQRGRGLLDQLRALADEPLLQDEAGPLAVRHREIACMIDALLRTVQAFPEAPSAQLRLSEGLENILDLIAERLALLTAAVGARRRETDRLDTLADLLTALAAGRAVDLEPFSRLAEALVDDAQQGLPLRFLHAPAQQPTRFVAGHSLTVAQVVARLVRHDPDWRGRPLEPVLAALVHDAGMVCVPAEVLARTGPLDEAGRRAVEEHVLDGAEMAARLAAGAAWLVEATAGHHERLDGTGYAAGLRDEQLGPLTRLLAVCDVYAALAAPRPQRPALDTRTALTDTLLLAEQGKLDRYQAEKLLQLSFYPVGSVVELADGAVGVVVATHHARRELNAPARPVLALLTDPQGKLLPAPGHTDLAECEGRSIVRGLPAAERRELLGGRYPELA
jgi:HD-GYP domain-containing protein (c-di-GMP phosphodiesterase class II)